MGDDKLSKLEKIGNWISTLLLGTTKELIIRTDERVSGLIKMTDEMKKSIDDIHGSINTHGNDIQGLKVHTRYGEAASPIKPTEAGEKLLADSKMGRVYQDHKETIFKKMDALGTRTLYDAEKNAQKVLESLADDPMMDTVKDYAINNPNEPLELIFKVASWVIRDDYWKEKNPIKE